MREHKVLGRYRFSENQVGKREAFPTRLMTVRWSLLLDVLAELVQKELGRPRWCLATDE